MLGKGDFVLVSKVKDTQRMFRCSYCSEMGSSSRYRQDVMLEYDDAQTTRMGTGCCKQKSKLFYDLLRLSPSPIDRLGEEAVRYGRSGCRGRVEVEEEM